VKRVIDFLETRGGVTSAWKKFAHEPVPRRHAWLFVLGSVALVALVVQFVTGLALALVYAPTPDHAHESVRAIEMKVAGGSLVRGLHHWCASAVVLLTVLHMMRTFWYGSYRKPRELNWIVGVVLLLLVLGFGFTGYLLPWDQKGYWATVVGTLVPAGMPGGGAISKLMMGGTHVGAYTLTRFYALHVMLLPLLTLALVIAHLALLRRHEHAGTMSGLDPREPFAPYQLARDAIVGLLMVAALLWLAARFPAPLERIADPADTSYVPRPEWYFLPLFQLLKYFRGPLEPIGTVIIPGLAVVLLALVPWLDRGTGRGVRARLPVLAVGTAAAAAVLVLLFAGAEDAPSTPPPSALGPGAEPPPDPHILGGAKAFTVRGCPSCHGAEGAGKPADSIGFALVGRTRSWDEAKLTAHAKEKAIRGAKPKVEDGENDPDKDLPSLALFVAALEDGPVNLAALPARVRQGGAAIDREDCRQCHEIYGQGGKRCPPLQHLLGRKRKSWLVSHFVDPRKFVPGSKMPSFKDLPEAELAAMAEYLLALP
jgi:ubiquinol-cytochrome c reductase cytochrome b subunit